MGKDVLLCDQQIKLYDILIRKKECEIRAYIREKNIDEIHTILRSYTQKQCKKLLTDNMGGKTLLYRALVAKDRHLVSSFVEHGANVNELVMREKYRPLLMTAVKLGDLDIIRLLDRLGVDLKKKDRKGANSIVHAVESKQLTLSRYLKLRGVDINCATSVLLCSKDMDFLKNALQFGFDVNFTGFCRNTALILATLWGRVDIMKVLVEHGADIHHRNSRGRNALIEGLSQKTTVEVEEYLRELYTREHYVECLEFLGADLMIFEESFTQGYLFWAMAFDLRNQMKFRRPRNACFAENIGVEIRTFKELKAIQNDSLKLLLQAILVFVRVLPVSHSHLHNAMAKVATNDTLIDDYDTTLGILMQLVMFHNPDANMCQNAGYKALKSGLCVLERTVFLDVATITEEVYCHRYELLYQFVSNNVWGVLFTCNKTNLTYYNCYKKYLTLVLELLLVREYEGLPRRCKEVSGRFLKILIARRIPLYPITLLHVAVEKQLSLSAVKILLDCGDDVTAKDVDGNTALDFACAYDDNIEWKKEIVNTLVQAGGNMKTVKAPVYRSPIAKMHPSKKDRPSQRIKMTIEIAKLFEQKTIDLISRLM